MSDIDDKSAEVAALRAECDRLRAENARLRSLLPAIEAEPQEVAPRPTVRATRAAAPPIVSGGDATVTSNSPAATKLALFRTLFSGRDDVFALRWQSGFGNLIALPLQGQPRSEGKSVFVGGDLRPARPVATALGREAAIADVDDCETPWTLPPSKCRLQPPINRPFPSALGVVSSNLIYIAKGGLPQSMQDRLIRLAAFENPE